MATNYDQKIKSASADMGRASKTAHDALDRLLTLHLTSGEGEKLDEVRRQLEIIRGALRDIRTSRDQIISWAEIAIERLQIAQSQKSR